MTSAEQKLKPNKISIVLLAAAAVYSFVPILVLYSDFSTLPARIIMDTTYNTKYAIGFFYVPLVTAMLAFGAFLLKLRASSTRLAELFAQVGLLLSGCLVGWWVAFESGFLPTILLPALFLLVVINDIADGRSPSKG